MDQTHSGHVFSPSFSSTIIQLQASCKIHNAKISENIFSKSVHIILLLISHLNQLVVYILHFLSFILVLTPTAILPYPKPSTLIINLSSSSSNSILHTFIFQPSFSNPVRAQVLSPLWNFPLSCKCTFRDIDAPWWLIVV